ncbi:bacterioferritin-associated ferredoxin [Streptomyces smyrnaeus]|uniref:Bacterioferritin-associated ferredoxin n=1 Tax=Streptomyces smyrnaeus TaxID=1387713 RepID=A0ABS3Y2S8_9ACTN|nr:(2Fe-2S)-binding protein [Streptomyces smyrnaeus]MBO8201975.1 (2Fe-2S)-binding protein [Streptomyces smyrnaeus]
MYVCSCFGITEEQVQEHAAAGACTPRQIASASKAGTDCGSCVRRIQGILGRGQCPRRAALDRGESPLTTQQPSTATTPEPAEVAAMAAQAPAPAAAARVAA